MTFKEAVWLAFNQPLRIVGWTYTYEEIKEKVGVYLNREVTKAFQEFDSLATIVSAALGGGSEGGKSSSPPPRSDKISSPEEVVRGVEELKRFLSGG